MKLIESVKAVEVIADYFDRICDTEYEFDESEFLRLMESNAEVDAELVVRCKYCKWGREACGNIECHVDLNVPPEYHGYDWYCPNGERKE